VRSLSSRDASDCAHQSLLSSSPSKAARCEPRTSRSTNGLRTCRAMPSRETPTVPTAAERPHDGHHADAQENIRQGHGRGARVGSEVRRQVWLRYFSARAAKSDRAATYRYLLSSSVKGSLQRGRNGPLAKSLQWAYTTSRRTECQREYGSTGWSAAASMVRGSERGL
jgi:hypothetical protein